MSWVDRELGEVLTLKRGYDLPHDQRIEGEAPVVSSSGITGFHNESKAPAPAVVTGRYGTLGEVYFVDKDCWPLNTSLYVKDFKGNRPKFIYYFLQSLLKGMESNKAAVPGVNRNDLHARKIKFPNDKRIQEKIEGLVAPYDDLIENNRRRIQLLEESARLLYQEWFVHLRFPGHEHVNIVDGMPEGWTKVSISQICIDIKDAVKPEDIDKNTPYIGLEHIPRRSITLNAWETAEKVTSNKYRFKSGDIILGKIRPYFHKIGFALCDGITSSDAIVIRPIAEKYYFLSLMYLSSDYFISLASKTVKEGSKMPRADWGYLLTSKVILPPEPLLSIFDERISKITSQLKILSIQNHALEKARDILLPRLMNGTISV